MEAVAAVDAIADRLSAGGHFLSLVGSRLAAHRVSVVIPARNEAASLPSVLDALPAGLHQVVLVDGASTDDTVAVARRHRPGIAVVAQRGTGKGDALAAGFAAATGDIIVMLDADGSMDPGEIPAFVDALAAGADLAKGSRFLPGGGSDDITVVRRAGNRFLGSLVNLLWRTRYSDLNYGYVAFWASCLAVVGPQCDGFEVETFITLRATSAGLRVAEVPSFESPRLHGRSNLRPVRDGIRVLRTIVAERCRRPDAPVVELSRV